MFKKIIVILIISLLAILFKAELAKVLHWLLAAHNQVMAWLGMIFSRSFAGQVLQSLFALLAIPVAVGLIAAIILLLIKKSAVKHAMTVAWIVWLILLVATL